MIHSSFQVPRLSDGQGYWTRSYRIVQLSSAPSWTTLESVEDGMKHHPAGAGRCLTCYLLGLKHEVATPATMLGWLDPAWMVQEASV